jgi:hypothetical protein
MTLERTIDVRPQADRLLAAKLTGKSRYHATWRPLTADEEAAAVAALREVAGGRATRPPKSPTPRSASARGSGRIRRDQDMLCCSRWSAVCWERVEGLGAAVFGGACPGADGVEASAAEQVGDDSKAWDSRSYGEPPALIWPISFGMTNSLEIGSHLCDGCVTDASRLTGPGCERTWVLASRPREDAAIRACRRWSCVAVRLTPPAGRRPRRSPLASLSRSTCRTTSPGPGTAWHASRTSTSSTSAAPAAATVP